MRTVSSIFAVRLTHSEGEMNHEPDPIECPRSNVILTAVFTATVVSKQDAADSDSVSPVVVNETLVEFMSSHQFDNVNPMGYGEFIEQDFSNDTTINLTLFSRFHEPLVWEQGMVNVTYLR